MEPGALGLVVGANGHHRRAVSDQDRRLRQPGGSAMRRAAFAAVALLFAGAPLRAEVTAVGLDKSAYTSDYAIGNVVVSVIFPESDGGIDPNIETWSPDRQAQVLSEIMTGLDWWTRQNPRSPLRFTVVSKTVSTKYEP